MLTSNNISVGVFLGPRASGNARNQEVSGLQRIPGLEEVIQVEANQQICIVVALEEGFKWNGMNAICAQVKMDSKDWLVTTILFKKEMGASGFQDIPHFAIFDRDTEAWHKTVFQVTNFQPRGTRGPGMQRSHDNWGIIEVRVNKFDLKDAVNPSPWPRNDWVHRSWPAHGESLFVLK